MTLREVGQRAGVSHTTPYRHFEDKRDLLACLAARELRDLADTLDAVDAVGTDRLTAAALAHLAWARAHPARFHLTFGPWSGPHEELGAAADAAVGAVRDLTRRAQDEGAVAGLDPIEAASLLWSAAHGVAQLELSGHLVKDDDSPSAEALLARHVALLG